MNRNINEDVAGYKNEFWKGLTFRECFFGVVAIVVGCGIILILTLKFKMILNLAVTLTMPVIAVIGMCGFYKKNGMTFFQIVRRKISLWRQKPLIYKSVSEINSNTQSGSDWLAELIFKHIGKDEKND